MNQSLLKVFTINFLVFLICIIIIEIFFGFWFSEHGFGPYMREHRLKKNHVILSYNNIKYDFFYKRNYHGFRGEEIDPSEIEAVIIGGSTTDERYKPIEFTIAENLNLLLKKKGYDFKITNAGIEGQSTYGHIFNFKNWFSRLKNFSPKLYIFYIGINDFSFGSDQDEYSNYETEGNIINPQISEVIFDYIKNSSFFIDKARILKQKYYSSNRIVKYDHETYLKNLKNFEYINYEEALKIHDVKKLKIKHKKIITKYLSRVKILNNYVKKKKSTAIFINQVLASGNKNETLFILNYSLIEYCQKINMHCIDLASKLDGKFNYWSDGLHTTGLGSKIIAETVIDDLIKIIKKKNVFKNNY